MSYFELKPKCDGCNRILGLISPKVVEVEYPYVIFWNNDYTVPYSMRTWCETCFRSNADQKSLSILYGTTGHYGIDVKDDNGRLQYIGYICDYCFELKDHKDIMSIMFYDRSLNSNFPTGQIRDYNKLRICNSCYKKDIVGEC